MTKRSLVTGAAVTKLPLMLRGVSREVALKIITDPDHRLYTWIDKLRMWGSDWKQTKRLCWVNVQGVPVDGWSENVFRQVAEEWGSPCEFTNCDFNESTDLRAGRVLILTERMDKINYFKNMIFNGTQRLIRIIEYSAEDGWESRKHRSGDTSEYSSELDNISLNSDKDKRDDGHWESQKV
ncbi:hypothetical protein Tco_0217826 [Tanacetum coccineum]